MDLLGEVEADGLGCPTFTESQTWRSHGGLSAGSGGNGEKLQGIRSIIGRYKIDRGEVKNSIGNRGAKNLYVQPMDMN